MIYFTSDTHFGHENIIRRCKRPFSDLHDMHESLIKNWQEKVQPTDIVYHLGDFSWGNYIIHDLINNLPGIKHLLVGNHDQMNTLKHRGWASVSRYLELKIEGRLVVLSHYPFASWNKSYSKSVHLHGHCHGNLQEKIPYRLDVGVDVHNYSPLSWTELCEKFGFNPPDSETCQLQLCVKG